MELKSDFFTIQKLEPESSSTLKLVKSKATDDLHDLKRKIVLMDKQECVFVRLDDIVYAEAKGAYTEVHLSTKKTLIVCKNIKTFSERLPDSEFIRVHKSYIININYIEKYVKSDGGYLILENGKNIPVSVRKRQTLQDLVDQWAV